MERRAPTVPSELREAKEALAKLLRESEYWEENNVCAWRLEFLLEFVHAANDEDQSTGKKGIRLFEYLSGRRTFSEDNGFRNFLNRDITFSALLRAAFKY